MGDRIYAVPQFLSLNNEHLKVYQPMETMVAVLFPSLNAQPNAILAKIFVAV